MSFGPPVLICDGCGKKRGESNHWHSLQISYEKPSTLEIVRRDTLRRDGVYFHACGDGCVVLLVQLFLTNGDLTGWRDPNQVVGAVIPVDNSAGGKLTWVDDNPFSGAA